jgi:hypothetical protein
MTPGASLQSVEQAAPLLQQEKSNELQTERGAQIKLNRTVEIRRVE